MYVSEVPAVKGFPVLVIAAEQGASFFSYALKFLYFISSEMYSSFLCSQKWLCFFREENENVHKYSNINIIIHIINIHSVTVHKLQPWFWSPGLLQNGKKRVPLHIKEFHVACNVQQME